MLREDTSRLNSPKMEYYREVYRNSVRWNGSEPLDNKHIIVYCEQGLGDQIQFARYVPELHKRYNVKTTLHCHESLHRLFGKMVCPVDVLDRETTDLPDHDYHTTSMSLPFLLQEAEVEEGYLGDVGSNDDIDQSSYNIGIAWEGNPNHSNNEERSCPLVHFQALQTSLQKLPLPVRFYSLHKEQHNPLLLEGAEDMELYGVTLGDMLDTARLVNSMNAIVSVDTSVLHLSGTLKKPTWAVLSHRHDHRWDVLQWYKTMTLVSQPGYGDWKRALQEVSRHLQEIIRV